MKPRFDAAQARLLRAIVLCLSNDGKDSVRAADVVVESIATRDWSSVTFVGARHRIVVSVADRPAGFDAAERLTLPGAVVAVEHCACEPDGGRWRVALDLLVIALDDETGVRGR